MRALLCGWVEDSQKLRLRVAHSLGGWVGWCTGRGFLACSRNGGSSSQPLAQVRAMRCCAVQQTVNFKRQGKLKRHERDASKADPRHPLSAGRDCHYYQVFETRDEELEADVHLLEECEPPAEFYIGGLARKGEGGPVCFYCLGAPAGGVRAVSGVLHRWVDEKGGRQPPCPRVLLATWHACVRVCFLLFWAGRGL